MALGVSVRCLRKSRLLLFVLVLAFAGCSGEDDEATKEQDRQASTNLNAIHAAYQTASEKNRRPPSDQGDLEKYLPDDMDKAAVFRSPRDEQEFVIVWGADLESLQQQAEPVVIAYEKNGRGGERFVLTSMGLLTMTDSEFDAAKFPPGHSP